MSDYGICDIRVNVFGFAADEINSDRDSLMINSDVKIISRLSLDYL
jgi:hypothetical protein